MIPGIGTDHTHDIFRYSQLRNIVGGQKKVREGDQYGTVDQNEPVLRQKNMTDIQQRIPQQREKADPSTPAGSIQSMEQD